MSITVVTPETLALRELIEVHRAELDTLLAKYGATNPRLFGSIARGEAGPDSDIDILVDMGVDSDSADLLFRAAGLMEEVRRLFERDVDIFPAQLLKRPISDSALAAAVCL